MGIKRWLSRRIGSYSISLAVAETVIQDIIHKPETQKFMDEMKDYRALDKVMIKIVEPYKITDPEYHEAFIEKWEEYKVRIYQYEFDKKREKYT